MYYNFSRIIVNFSPILFKMIIELIQRAFLCDDIFPFQRTRKLQFQFLPYELFYIADRFVNTQYG